MQNNETREIVLQMIFWGFMMIMFVVSIAATGYLAWNVGKLALWRMDDVACQKLQSQSVEFKDFGFYITPEEAERCADYQIDAPVERRPLFNE